ncbi:MAG TPA: dephospho-CoA kinase [Candidatus Dormibacteraeota bacterium]|jgi:dephospho-CoA kinase
MRVVGLTGGIASGKSTVSALFKALGAEVVDADQLAREVVEPGQPALAEIIETFGREILGRDGRLDRARLANTVFKDPASRARLEAITHPRIRQRIVEEIEARGPRRGLLILDIPLLYERPPIDPVKEVVVVWVDPLTQLNRLVERDGLDEETARARIATQMPLDEKKGRADHVIDNSGSREQTRQQVERVYRRLQAT